MSATFCTQCGDVCPCQNHKRSGLLVPFLLVSLGLFVLFGMAYSLTQLMPTPTPALPPTAPAARTSFASPSPTTAVPSSPTPDPFAPTSTPAILLVMEVTQTPTPTPTLSPYEATLRAGQATATALAMPLTCERTTVTPGTPKPCYWMPVLPTPSPIPTLPPCETPVPAMRCLKMGD